MSSFDLSMPGYAGGYDMANDAAQAEMDGLRYRIMGAVLGEERTQIQYALQREWQEAGRGHPGSREITEAQLAAVRQRIASRLDARDEYGWTVRELLVECDKLREGLP